MTDDDVDYFPKKTSTRVELKIPLFITYKQKYKLATPTADVYDLP